MQSYMRANQVQMDVLLDARGAFVKTYKISGYPTSVIVDQHGTVRAVRLGWGSQSLDQLKQLVDQFCPAG
jgi:hypothetical protein